MQGFTINCLHVGPDKLPLDINFVARKRSHISNSDDAEGIESQPEKRKISLYRQLEKKSKIRFFEASSVNHATCLCKIL